MEIEPWLGQEGMSRSCLLNPLCLLCLPGQPAFRPDTWKLALTGTVGREAETQACLQLMEAGVQEGVGRALHLQEVSWDSGGQGSGGAVRSSVS